MADTEYLDRFESILEDGLLNLSKQLGLLEGEMLESADITGKWNDYVKDYVGDAVDNFNEYPEFTIACAAYFGMAAAHDWDADFELFKSRAYKDYYGPRGFDDMDEHIVDYIGLDESQKVKLKLALQSIAVAAQGLMRHENIEANTEDGFFILVRIYGVMFRLGAAMELNRLGYRNVNIANAQ